MRLLTFLEPIACVPLFSERRILGREFDSLVFKLRKTELQGKYPCKRKVYPSSGFKSISCASFFSSASLCCESTAVDFQIFHCESTSKWCPVLSRRDFISWCLISFNTCFNINRSTLSGIRKWSRGTALPDRITNCFAAGSVLPIPVAFL